MILQIEIPDGDHADHLSQVATDNQMTPEQYATSLVMSWIEPRLREVYIAYFTNLSTQDLKTASQAADTALVAATKATLTPEP